MCKNHHLLRVSALCPWVLFASSHIPNSHAINALSFSHDGEYLAISNTSTYIDIVSHYRYNILPLLLTLSRSALWKLACQSIGSQLQAQSLQ